MTTESTDGQVVVYETQEREVRVDVRLEHDTVWLSAPWQKCSIRPLRTC
jgi:hypothetical protein